MKKLLSIAIAFLLGIGLVLIPFQQFPKGWTPASAFAQSVPPRLIPALSEAILQIVKPAAPSSSTGIKKPTAKPGTKPTAGSFEELVKKSQRLSGLFTLYRERPEEKLFLEVRPDQLNVNFLCIMTLESGLGEQGLYSGLPLADFVFTLRRVNNAVQFVVPNLYFRTQPGDPLQRSVRRSFSDSVLASLPIKATHPTRKTLLLDLKPLFLGDLPGLTPILAAILQSPYTLDQSKSYFGRISAFPENVELESVYGFSGGDGEQLPAFLAAVPDSRSFNLRVRYSLSQLPTNNGYKPRLADDRIGYFITAFQNLSDESPSGPFVRYVNRWHLEKADPSAPLSPPKQPIVFWIENTVPVEYRQAVRDGILMWNRAFEKAGFVGAIEARQMPDKASWDPADIRYNTIRWLSTYEAGFLGIGPSRVNPLTGQILDADILIDVGIIRYLKQQYRSLAQRDPTQWIAAITKLTGNPDACSYGMVPHAMAKSAIVRGSQLVDDSVQRLSQPMGNYDLCFGMESARQFSIGSMSMAMLHNVLPGSAEMTRYVNEFLSYVIAHEVGHTLGLRHNFRASTMLPPNDLNNREITRQLGLVGSVMDYSAVNLAPQGTAQGDFFTQVVGPYDEWAIAYGYTPSGAASTQAERPFLAETARRAPDPTLTYATDEDTFARLDPKIQRFDLSQDLLTYAPWQFENARAMWQVLDRRYPAVGDSFSEVRAIFDEIFDYYFQYGNFLTHYIGGQEFNRYRGGDAIGRLPFEWVPIADQRKAMDLLRQYVFAPDAFRFSPSFINKLAPSRWSHWGEWATLAPLDYPIYDRLLRFQTVILGNLLRPDRLSRLRDAELKAAPGQTLTLPELFDRLHASVWQEVLEPKQALQLSSLRRGLQREYLSRLSQMVLRADNSPDDARTLARYQLKELGSTIEQSLRRQPMDKLSRAHLEESRDRIIKTLNAPLFSD